MNEMSDMMKLLLIGRLLKEELTEALNCSTNGKIYKTLDGKEIDADEATVLLTSLGLRVAEILNK